MSNPLSKIGVLTSNWQRELAQFDSASGTPKGVGVSDQRQNVSASSRNQALPAALLELGHSDHDHPDEAALVYRNNARAAELAALRVATPVGAPTPNAAIGEPVSAAFSAFSVTTTGSHAVAASVAGVDLSSTPNKASLTLDDVAKGVTYTVSTSYSYSAGGKVRVYAIDDQTGRKYSLGSTGGSFTAQSSGSYTIEVRATKGTLSGTLSSTVYGDANLPSKSGNKLVDALIAGGDYFWQDSDQIADGVGLTTVGGTTIDGRLKSLSDTSHRATITYGFLTGAPTLGSDNEQDNGEALGSNTQAAVAAAFDYYGQLLNVTFVEQDVEEYDGTNPSDATDIIFGLSPQESSNGYAYYPNGSYAKDSTYVFFNSNTAGFDNDVDAYVSEGQYGWTTIVHEIGHALGLKHPGNYNAGGGGTPPPYLPASYDNHQYSIMSYYGNKYTQGRYADTAQLLDVAALQYLYGVNSEGSNATGGVFDFTDPTATYLKTLWSQNGTDVIDLDGLTNSSIVNLNAGKFSSINIIGSTRDTSYSGNFNVAIAYGAKINNVQLSTESAEDMVVLNAAFKEDTFNSITNFSVADDKIGLSKSVFGKLNGSNIYIADGAEAATSRRQRIIVDSASGTVYYDRDGSGTRYAIEKIAEFDDLDGLTKSNFSFVA